MTVDTRNGGTSTFRFFMFRSKKNSGVASTVDTLRTLANGTPRSSEQESTLKRNIQSCKADASHIRKQLKAPDLTKEKREQLQFALLVLQKTEQIFATELLVRVGGFNDENTSAASKAQKKIYQLKISRLELLKTELEKRLKKDDYTDSKSSTASEQKALDQEKFALVTKRLEKLTHMQKDALMDSSLIGYIAGYINSLERTFGQYSQYLEQAVKVVEKRGVLTPVTLEGMAKDAAREPAERSTAATLIDRFRDSREEGKIMSSFANDHLSYLHDNISYWKEALLGATAPTEYAHLETIMHQYVGALLSLIQETQNYFKYSVLQRYESDLDLETQQILGRFGYTSIREEEVELEEDNEESQQAFLAQFLEMSDIDQIMYTLECWATRNIESLTELSSMLNPKSAENNSSCTLS